MFRKKLRTLKHQKNTVIVDTNMAGHFFQNINTFDGIHQAVPRDTRTVLLYRLVSGKVLALSHWYGLPARGRACSGQPRLIADPAIFMALDRFPNIQLQRLKLTLLKPY